MEGSGNNNRWNSHSTRPHFDKWIINWRSWRLKLAFTHILLGSFGALSNLLFLTSLNALQITRCIIPGGHNWIKNCILIWIIQYLRSAQNKKRAQCKKYRKRFEKIVEQPAIGTQCKYVIDAICWTQQFYAY